MAVVHEHMPPVARLDGVGIRLPGQQRVRIGCGAMDLIAKPDATEVALRTFLGCFGLTKALKRQHNPGPRASKWAGTVLPL
jgi:hypothetical protein